ncbi:ABC transporter ATP-binding protein [Cellulomonas sp. PhB150]|uniref:ABC transporter ATP-binding protein n=1 Tax=Cellulomonas sp. PhB150 TaxID=2485188 RepID=UPI000F4802B9|nr:ABC transporter ATP-binding protein [Cellulomonas sp. PhB150]ROS22961.1 putative ABC transport system ATP-binding protein [Cellulomonas sp. PhB150]
MAAAAELVGVSVEHRTPQGTVHALQSVSLSFASGTSTAVTGRSGSGKSTLVSVLALLRRPTTGTVQIGGQDMSSLTDSAVARVRSSSVGVVFQAFHLDQALTAAQNVMLPWYFRTERSPRRPAVKRAEDLLELVGIGDLRQRRPSAMSGGQRQRVAIARALFGQPALLLADEPTGNLDEDTANDVASTLLALPREVGTTLVLVTHDVEVASAADRRLEITRGRLDETS